MKNEVDHKLQSSHRKLKIILVGSYQVGKSSLIKKIINNQFNDTYDPTIYDEYTFEYNEKIEKFIKNEIYEDLLINFIDTGDFDKNISIFEKDLYDSDYYFMLYSVDKQESFSTIKTIITKLKNMNIIIDEKNCLLIANKTDLETDKLIIDSIVGHKAKVEFQVNFLEISIKNDLGIKQIFDFIIDNEINKIKKNINTEKDLCKCF